MATEGVVEETSTASMVGEWDVAVATIITSETRGLNRHSRSEKVCSQTTFSITEGMDRQPAGMTSTYKATQLGTAMRRKKCLVHRHNSADVHQRLKNEAEAEECTQVVSFQR